MFTDFHIKAPDEPTALQAAHQAGQQIGLMVTQEDEETGELSWLRHGSRHALVINTKLVDEPAQFDDEGSETSPATYHDGWFALLRVRDEIAQEVAAAIQDADPYISVTELEAAALT